MTDFQKIRALTENKLQKALQHFEYSLKKVQSLSHDVTKLDDEALETWESFAARFSRLTDIYLSRYIRVRALLEDPAFRGTFKDFLLFAEKAQIISDAQHWFAVRELRNKAAHDYDEETLSEFFQTLLHESNFVISEIKKNLP